VDEGNRVKRGCSKEEKNQGLINGELGIGGNYGKLDDYTQLNKRLD
jgi:hypothetical protein